MLRQSEIEPKKEAFSQDMSCMYPLYSAAVWNRFSEMLSNPDIFKYFTKSLRIASTILITTGPTIVFFFSVNLSTSTFRYWHFLFHLFLIDSVIIFSGCCYVHHSINYSCIIQILLFVVSEPDDGLSV